MPERQVITSLVGTIAPMLTVDTRSLENIAMAAIYAPREWKKTTPFVKDDLTVQPQGTSSMNQEMAFEIPKFAHFILDAWMQKVAPPHIIAPPGNPAQYIDFLGYSDLDYFRVTFASNMNYERRRYDLWFNYIKSLTDEKKATEDYLVRANQSVAQRQADLINGVTTITDLRLPFSEHLSQAFPLHVISQKLRLIYRSVPLLDEITTTIPGTTVTPNGSVDYQLLLRVAHVTGDEARCTLDMSRTAAGISYMIHQNVRQESDNNLTSTVTGQPVRIRLSNLTKPLQYLSWGLIPTKLINNTGRNDLFVFTPNPTLGPVPPGMTPYNPIASWNITANGQIVQRSVTRDITRMAYWNKFHESRGGEEIFEQNYTEFPHAVNAAVGYLDYTNLNNPVLEIITGLGGFGFDPDIPANAQALTLILNARDYNFWFLNHGNFTRAFNS